MLEFLFARNFLLALSLFHVKISEIQTLKCRSREHTRQEEDFYYLVNKCLKESTNGSNSTAHLPDHRHHQIQGQRPQEVPITQMYQQQRQQQHQQQSPRYHPSSEHLPNRKPSENYHHNVDQHRNSPYDTYKVIKQSDLDFDHDNGERSRNLPNTCTCISHDGQIHRYGFNERYRTSSIQYHEKRETISSKTYERTNSSTNDSTTLKKSPLENIDACVIHCIFRDLKMLNDENKVDRQSMLLIMTLRIQEPELKEFIEDSIDECYDFLDTGIHTDNHEELCNISKKLALCLEERAKRACDDWEVRGETPMTSTTGFIGNKNFGSHREGENRYSNGANQGGIGPNSLKNGFNNRNLNFSPRKPKYDNS